MRAVSLSFWSILFLSSLSWGQSCNDAIKRTAHETRFSIDPANPSVAEDLVTGLVWQRCSIGLIFNDNGSTDIAEHSCDQPPENTDDDPATMVQNAFNWNDAVEAAAAEGAPWRMPNVKELSSIIDYACFSPAIDERVFPNMIEGFHWSNSPNADDETDAWAITTADGNDEALIKTTTLPVLLVRD